MSNAAVAHLVFVDFENVPHVDLDAIASLPVVVTLLIGKNQTKLDTSLVAQIHRHAGQVRLVEVGASGRNALDLTLAYYLGFASGEGKPVQLHIVSKDKDFEPLIAHLRSKNQPVTRSDSFAALPFLPPRKSAAPAKKSAPVVKKITAPAEALPAAEKLEKLITRLQTNAGPRPKRKKSLLRHINTAYGNKLTEPELLALVDELVTRGICQVSDRDQVTY